MVSCKTACSGGKNLRNVSWRWIVQSQSVISGWNMAACEKQQGRFLSRIEYPHGGKT